MNTILDAAPRLCFILCCAFVLGSTGVKVAKATEIQPKQDAPPSINTIGTALTFVGQICTPRGGVRIAPEAAIRDDVLSPKSVHFTKDGKRIYVNALEGFATLVFSFPELQEEAVIKHSFTKDDAQLFHDETTIFDYRYYHKSPGGDLNVFSGKPVEAAFSHQGKYLWTPYYRRDFDSNASSPSAVAVIDTQTNTIVRVMPTGPLPKVVAISSDNTMAAITHWGDNTVAIIDISSQSPADFTYIRHLVVGHQMSTAGLTSNRDNNCGSCLRGTTFTPDSRYFEVVPIVKTKKCNS